MEGAMWVRRGDYDRLKRRSDQLEQVIEQARKAVSREVRRRADAEQRLAEMAERFANRPIQVVQPPDTAAIVKQTVEGIATVLNGWKDTPHAMPTVQTTLSMDTQGLDDRAGVPQSVDDFMPPWEQGFPDPRRAEYVNARIGEYKPYIPGDGNTVQPKGGME
jgi:hypothetical protein